MSTDTGRAPSSTLVAPRETSTRRRLEVLFGRDYQVAWLFAAPMLVLMLGLIGWPILTAFWMSFFNVLGPNWGAFVGLQNYIDQWQDPVFRDSFQITTRFTFFSLVFKFMLGMVAALLLHNTKRFTAVLTPLVLLPFVIPEVVAAMTWRSLFDPVFGGLNAILAVMSDATGGLIGTTRGLPWTSDANWAVASMVLVNVWGGVPFFALLTLAGLKAIDAEQYDAAAVDGANAWQRFLHVTLPGLRYVIIVETLLSTISTFNAFGLIYLITGGGPGGATRVYAVLAFEKIGALRYSQGVAVALTMAPILLIAIIVLGRYMRQGQKGDFGGESAAWNLFMLVLWPVRIVIRGLLRVFWAVNDVLEVFFGAVSRTVGQLVTRGRPENAPAARRVGRRVGTTLRGSALALVILFELFPFYWVMITAFKAPEQIRAFKSIFWPAPFTLQNFQKLLGETDFLVWMFNTAQVAIVSSLIGVVVSAMGAYALVRLRWRGAGTISSTILIAYLMPGIMLVVPLYQVFANLKVINTLAALMIAYPTFQIPFACWLLMGYYRSIPEELEDAAMIDGCNRLQAFFKIVFPLVSPALLAVALLGVTRAWNEFLFAFVFISANKATTLSVGLGRMVIGDIFPWGLLMSASLLMAIPVMLLYSFGNRFLVAGLTAGSVKG
jgi:multiple sugar transport system permease protein